MVKSLNDTSLSTTQKYQRYVNTSFVDNVEPIVLTGGQGAVVTDVAGHDYVDCFAGIAVTNAGHSNKAVLEAAAEQMRHLVHCCSYVYHVPVVADLAELLASVTPGDLSKTFFGNSGAEAIEGAMRLAKVYTGRSEFVSLQQSFHGRTAGTLSVTGNAKRKTRGTPYVSGTAFGPCPYCYRCPLRARYPQCDLACADYIDLVFRYETAGDVAAFIAEPVLGEGGIIPPPPGYFERIREVLEGYKALFIADEVQTGFGRTGKLFGIQHFDIVPDIMCMAKGIANGFPLGAFIARPEIADAFRPGEHLSTFGGNPVSCAAAVANIRYLQEQRLPEQAAEKGEWLTAQLMRLMERHPLIGDVRGKGLMVGVELVTGRDSKEPASAAAKAVRAFCREHGVLVGVGGSLGNVVRFQPPLVITYDQLEQAVSAFGGALAATAP